MNKVLVSFYNTNKIGGPNTSMKNLVKSFLKNKYDFRGICINEHLGIIPKINVIKRLVSEIKKYSPDIIVVGGLQLHGFYMMISSYLAGYHNATLLVVHGSACDNVNFNKFKYFLFRRIIEPLTLKLSYITITVCDYMSKREIITQNCRRFGGVIYNAIPIIDNCDIKNESIRKQLGISSSTIVLTYTGRLVYDKGITFLLEAIAKITINEGIILLIVGEGKDKDYFIDYANKLSILSKVYFIGKRDDVIEILKETDIYVFPSLHENLPNSLLEACSIGIPVISTNVGGIPEIIIDGKNGILVEKEDVNCLVNAIEKLCSDGALREEMSLYNKAYIENKFSQDVVFKKYDEIFKSIIQNKY